MARAKAHRNLWKVVRQVILNNYGLLSKRTIRGSYYIVRDILASKIGVEVSQEDYNWLLTDQGYATYRDDVWPQMECDYQLERPEAAVIGVLYDRGLEKPVSELGDAWDRARGFIFVEKADEAKAIKTLSEYGWTITAGRGYPLRLVRRLLKEDIRPVLALHDWDRDGEGIYRALGFETRRTAHLDIALGDRVIDLGLLTEHVERLKLPTQPSPPKYEGKPRVELSALEVLASRLAIDNPVLAYTTAVMALKGFMLSPTEEDKVELMKRYLRHTLTDGLMEVVNKAIESFEPEMGKMNELKGRAVEGVSKEGVIKYPRSLLDDYIRIAFNEVKDTEWRYESDLHREALKFTDPRLMDLLSA